MTDRSYAFVKALEFTLPWECGRKPDGSLNDVVHYRDGGLPTKFGIWQGAHKNVDVAKLTLPDAVTIYKQEYWDVYPTLRPINANLDNLPPALAVVVFDSGVNCGVGMAIKWLDLALSGNKNPARVVCDQRGMYYAALVNKDRTKYGPNYSGWLKRLGDLRKQSDILEAEAQQTYNVLEKIKAKGIIDLLSTKPKEPTK